MGNDGLGALVDSVPAKFIAGLKDEIDNPYRRRGRVQVNRL
ncbi:MAG: hypothetical protein ACLPY5_02125 [Candidatus Bathyarchaeia archaeon]